MKNLIFYYDSRHGWLKVSKKDYAALNLPLPSPYSFEGKTSYYLEEDCDAGVYLNALKAAGIEYKVEQKEDKSGNIRRKNYVNNPVQIDTGIVDKTTPVSK